MPFGAKILSSFAGLELRDYYSSACPHCKHLDPAWKEASESYSGPVTFRKIECADENWDPVAANQELCKGIHGYPTIKLFNGDTEVTEYTGNRSAESLKSFAQEHEKVVAAALPLAPALLCPTQRCRSNSSEARRRAMADFF
mmetsp:Transcript_6665/g.10692  ORF Transcript_6665/g.10692 Transcript_6665/m.10692 type:complete len:142 (+) Transcript_6665:55-480(+)|eukprot:CAMPEP_0169119024 /NCGR_PEP_ID=MMETSP1015-20121227/31323_1 /TAXON_ID=342587 /ORGANISM="Karlodinium micrum, Strain CCMP2283" /LENGTH=141 /DNA_ID=CAMNT_0009181851 /DNA_START=55 /DNA_END=480 /DNA_ORIENTATION=-